MQFTIPHKTTRADAVSRVKNALEQARPKLAEQAQVEKEEWVGDTLNFAAAIQGQHISGSIAIDDANYDITVKLPLLMRPFEGRLKKMLEAQMAGQLQ